jgi:hypothetical protein
VKKIFKIGVIIGLLLLFKGSIYRWAVHYRSIGTRSDATIVHPKLIKKIESMSDGQRMDVDKLIAIAGTLASRELVFTTQSAETDPNRLIDTHQANCIGYAAMFNAIAQYLIRQHHLEKSLEARHHIGKLTLFGVDVHAFFQSPFFRDHDFNEIKNLTTGEVIAVDPSVWDYFWIERVCFLGH